MPTRGWARIRWHTRPRAEPPALCRRAHLMFPPMGSKSVLVYDFSLFCCYKALMKLLVPWTMVFRKNKNVSPWARVTHIWPRINHLWVSLRGELWICMDNGICKIKTITELSQQTLKGKLNQSGITVMKAGMPAGTMATSAPRGQAEGRNPVITASNTELGMKRKPLLSPLSKVRRCRLPETRTMCRTPS